MRKLVLFITLSVFIAVASTSASARIGTVSGSCAIRWDEVDGRNNVQVLTNALDAAVAALEKSLAGSKPGDPRDLGQSAQAVRSIYCKIDQIAAKNNQSAIELVHDKVINQRISQTFLTLAIAATDSNDALNLLVEARALLERGGNGDRASELSNRINSAFFSLYIRTNQIERAGFCQRSFPGQNKIKSCSQN